MSAPNEVGARQGDRQPVAVEENGLMTRHAVAVPDADYLAHEGVKALRDGGEGVAGHLSSLSQSASFFYDINVFFSYCKLTF